MIKNTASQVVSFQMVSTTDGSNVTTGTPAVYVTGDGGTQAAGSGTIAHEGNGCWSYVVSAADSNYNHVSFTMVLTGAVSQTINVYPVTLADYKADVSGLATAAALTTVDTVVDAIKAVTDNLPNSGALTGLAQASVCTETRLAELDAANLPANVDAILTDTSTTLEGHLTDIKGATFAGATDSLEAIRNQGDSAWVTAIGFSTHSAADVKTAIEAAGSHLTLILADTGELQTNQGAWATATGFSTHSAADTADAVWDEAIAGHVAAGSFGAKNQKVVPSETIGDYKADVSSLATSAALATTDGKVDNILTDTGTTLDGKIDSILADTGTTLDGKLDDLLEALVYKQIITEANGNTEIFNVSNGSKGTVASAFTTDGTYTQRLKLVV